MSVDLIFPRNDEVQSNVVELIPDEPPLPGQAVRDDTKSRERWMGILGLIGVLTIFGLTLYSVVRYLL